MGIKENTEILSSPLKIKEFELTGLLIKEQKNKYKLMFISFLLGFVSSVGMLLLSNMTEEDSEKINVQEILHTVSSQADLIQSLTDENTNLRLTLKNVEVSSDLKN